MSLTVDTITFDDDVWDAPLGSPTVGDWLWSLWGQGTGASSLLPRFTTVHPACTASADWLGALWAVV